MKKEIYKKKNTTKQKPPRESFLVSYSVVSATPLLLPPLSFFAPYLFLQHFDIELPAWMASMVENGTAMD